MEIKFKIKSAREEIGLNDKVTDELQYLEDEHSFGYLTDMIFAQQYAESNRFYITNIILNIFNINQKVEKIESVHNFIDFKDFIIRKGAIKSYIGETFVIPMTPKDGILICKGKSNPEWNYSAPHGCGRIMSRSKAKKILSDEDVENAMKGIYASEKPKDESPLVYKNSKIIEKLIEPTAKIIGKLKPIMNMKTK